VLRGKCSGKTATEQQPPIVTIHFKKNLGSEKKRIFAEKKMI